MTDPYAETDDWPTTPATRPSSDAKRTLLSRNAAAEVAAAVVAALNLPERDRETAAKALDEAAEWFRAESSLSIGNPERGHWFRQANRILRVRASALRERRES